MVFAMSDDPTSAEKKRLRALSVERRKAAYAKHGVAASERLAAHGLGFLGLAPGTMISAFAAIRDEIDPAPLLKQLHGAGMVLALPVMQGKDMPLLFRRWTPGDAMAETMWGIREPLPSAPVIEPDVVLVPLLAFDRAGYRLGYGGGFYDRSLQRLRAMKSVIAVGLAYDELGIDAVPHLDYDEPLDWVLTPSGPMKCNAPSPHS